MFGKRERESSGKRGEPVPEANEGLPDTHRPNGLCPRCGRLSSFEHTGWLPVTFDGGYILKREGGAEPTVMDRVSSLICRHCGQGVAVVEEEWVGESRKKDSRSGGTISYRGLHWWPLPESNLPDDIPNAIAGVFGEAAAALAAGCPRASAVMARRTVEAICDDKGESAGTLAQRLASLVSKNVLHPTLAEWAKEVRLVGNVGAHFDPINSVSSDDAQQLLSFVRELLKYQYQLPAELARRRGGTAAKTP